MGDCLGVILAATPPGFVAGNGAEFLSTTAAPAVTGEDVTGGALMGELTVVGMTVLCALVTVL